MRRGDGFKFSSIGNSLSIIEGLDNIGIGKEGWFDNQGFRQWRIQMGFLIRGLGLVDQCLVLQWVIGFW